MYDIIIVGAGPAGLTAAIYLKRASKKVLVLESSHYGGQIVNAANIENYPAEMHISGFDFATKVYEQAKKLGAEIVFDRVIEIIDGDIKTVKTSNNIYNCKAIIIATGSASRNLGLENEQELIGRGISYCATCDGNFFKGKDVAVVGGGNNALEDAIYLSDIANKVYLIHRKDSFKADEELVKLVEEKENVVLVFNSNITKIIGKEKLERIEITDNDSNMSELDIAGLFIAVGRVPNFGNIASPLKVDSNGFIEAGEDCLTNIDGVFVAGDIRTKKVRQIVTATSDGAIAAINAVKYINERL